MVDWLSVLIAKSLEDAIDEKRLRVALKNHDVIDYGSTKTINDGATENFDFTSKIDSNYIITNILVLTGGTYGTGTRVSDYDKFKVDAKIGSDVWMEGYDASFDLKVPLPPVFKGVDVVITVKNQSGASADVDVVLEVVELVPL